RPFASNRATGPQCAVTRPIASEARKAWPAAPFLARAARLGMEPIFVAGPGEDLSAFHGCRTVIGAPLAEIKRLLAGASLFLGNDSGPAHMAAAFGLPVVVLFGPSNVDVWSPWKTPAETLAAANISDISTE